jgi:hypothetical protein
VLRVLVRCVRLLGDARWHLVALCVGFAGLALALLAPSLLFLDLFWTRALQGEALPAVQAALLRLDPAVTVGVPALSVAVRRSVALRTVIGGVAITALALRSSSRSGTTRSGSCTRITRRCGSNCSTA